MVRDLVPDQTSPSRNARRAADIPRASPAAPPGTLAKKPAFVNRIGTALYLSSNHISIA